jgi:hypothetical protein
MTDSEESEEPEKATVPDREKRARERERGSLLLIFSGFRVGVGFNRLEGGLCMSLLRRIEDSYKLFFHFLQMKGVGIRGSAKAEQT